MSRHPPASEIHLSNPTPTTPHKRAYIIFFITGNPGLIEYYRTFLTHVYGLLGSFLASGPGPAGATGLHVYGRSLCGFETAGAVNGARGECGGGRPPFSLQEQISGTQEALERVVREVGEREGTRDVRVVLMGHSVGAYILLEVVRRLREKVQRDREAVRVVGGVCLFPTVTHIAKSDSGRKATVSDLFFLHAYKKHPPSPPACISITKKERSQIANHAQPLFNLPHFALNASLLAKALTFLIPLSLFTLLIQKVMSFPADAAHVTASFVKSPHGVRQALHMARDEMSEITVDEWDDDIWGALKPSTHPHPRPVLRFLFAKKDHWVADETRDELIKARGRLGGDEGDGIWRPVMEVDEEKGWVHGFCIKQSVSVAEKVCEWLKDIIQRDLGQ